MRVAPRGTVLRRTADDTDPVERVLVANADQLVVVSALANPEPRPRLIDRCLVAAYDAGMEPLLVLTKADLTDPGALPRAVRRAVGAPPRHGAARRHAPTASTRCARRCRGGSACSSATPGSARARSSTPWCPLALRATGVVNDVTGRGRHTSSSAVALALPDDDGWIIDTPGIRSFGLAHVDPARIIQHFPDLEPGTAQCPRGCTHDEEECALDAWVDSGAAGPGRAVPPGLAAPAAAGAHPHDRRLTH